MTESTGNEADLSEAAKYYRSFGIQITRCRSCNAVTLRVRHERTGSYTLVDVEPSLVGTIRIDGATCSYAIESPLRGRPFVTAVTAQDAWRHTSHFATCPDAERHRRERAPAPDPSNIVPLPLDRGRPQQTRLPGVDTQ